MRFQSYFNTAMTILGQYDGKTPLSHYLKNYFSQHKKHGSKDRKFITHLCYCYFRLGSVLVNSSTEERLKTALFICNSHPDEWDILFDKLWIENRHEELHKRIDFIKHIYPDFKTEDVFILKDELSNDIVFADFALSHFIQPDLFLRIRPDKEKKVKQKLSESSISFKEISATCLSLSNSTKIDDILKTDEDVVIQDYSSQRIQEFLQLITYNSSPVALWDCCAASGGKSILANDVLKNIRLTVSDVRPSILHNLEKRFAKAGIKNYQSFVANLSNSSINTHHSLFDLIIADVPCTGSGTWSRTPEQLFFFDKKSINEYAMLQKKIISNTVQQLKKDGYFLYITCSVFKKENEENVAFMQQQFGLQLIKQELLTGYNTKADTMFAALLKKSPSL